MFLKTKSGRRIKEKRGSEKHMHVEIYNELNRAVSPM